MKFTAQEEYGLRCILNLARLAPPEGEGQAGEERSGAFGPSLTVAEIARKEGLTVQYAGKLIRILGRAGILRSERGRKGGYRLARPAEKISVAEVLQVLGGRIYAPRMCERYRGDRASCVHTNDCAIRSLWSGLQLMIDQVLARTSLRDLVLSEKNMAEWMQSRTEAANSVSLTLSLPVLKYGAVAARENGERLQNAGGGGRRNKG
jgi:Rrf2 family protein